MTVMSPAPGEPTEFAERLQDAVGDRYRIERELGSGAMGVVYLAEDLKLGRKVAIKVLRPEVGESVGEARFVREIQISAQLSHPHILSLIDSGVAHGLLYYVMYYMPGESLRQRIKRESQLPVGEAVQITRQVAEALDHAHRNGVIHRDVKPGNILLQEGHPLVCDFGIARAVEDTEGERLTRTGFAIGTPAYMSPEQGTGEVAVDHRADIYALGCVLYEMLVGSPPFTGAPAHVIMARKSAQAAPGLRVVRDTIPEHVERAVLKALARTPADRFDSAAAFANALADPGQAARSTRRGRWLPAARRSAPLAAAAIVGVAAAAGAVLLLTGGDGPAPLRVRASQVTARPGLEASPSISPDGEWLVYAAEDGADRDIYLQSVQGSINLTDDVPGDDHAPAFSSDGQQIAFRSSRSGGGLFVMGRMGEAVRKVSDRGESPAWSPDGRALAYSLEHVGVLPLNIEPHRPGLWTVDLGTGEHQELVGTDAVLPSWSPDGRWIAYTGRSGGSDIWLVPAAGGEPVRVTDDDGNDWGPAWSPDSRVLYFSSDRAGPMSLWRVEVDPGTGAAVGDPELLPTPSRFAAHPSVSGDGTRVLYTDVTTTQNIEWTALDPQADTLLDPFLVTRGNRQWSSPDPSPDGSRVAFYSRDLPEGDLYIANRDGTGLRQLTADSAIDRVPRWSPDGSSIAYFSNRSGLLHTWVISPDGSGNRRLTNTDDLSVPGGWSPDGRRMAITTTGTGFILDPSRSWEEQVVEPLARDTAWPNFSANDWSPDGTRLAGMSGFADLGVGYYDVATGEHVQLTDFGQWPVWMPDSRRILFVSGGTTFYMVDTETGVVDTVHSTVRDVLGPPRVTADGRELVYSRRVTEGDIWLATIEEGPR
jgi:Tol biopolymer transport system component